MKSISSIGLLALVSLSAECLGSKAWWLWVNQTLMALVERSSSLTGFYWLFQPTQLDARLLTFEKPSVSVFFELLLFPLMLHAFQTWHHQSFLSWSPRQRAPSYLCVQMKCLLELSSFTLPWLPLHLTDARLVSFAIALFFIFWFSLIIYCLFY